MCKHGPQHTGPCSAPTLADSVRQVVMRAPARSAVPRAAFTFKASSPVLWPIGSGQIVPRSKNATCAMHNRAWRHIPRNPHQPTANYPPGESEGCSHAPPRRAAFCQPAVRPEFLRSRGRKWEMAGRESGGTRRLPGANRPSKVLHSPLGTGRPAADSTPKTRFRALDFKETRPGPAESGRLSA